MLKVSNLSIEFSKVLFNNISFVLGNKEKVGLVGLNGTGKTTLLRLITGQEVPEAGKIEVSKDEHIEYLPQEYSFPKNIMVGELLEDMVANPKTEMYKVTKVLNRLGLADIDIFADVNTLSEGQKMKLYLAKLLVNNPTILLLDEPTNHLDITGIRWLEGFIKDFDGICIIISHDRFFMNNVTTHIFEIDEQKLYTFKGNYNDFLNQKAELLEKRKTQYFLQEKHREKLINLIEKTHTYAAGEKQSRALSAAKHRLVREVLNKEISEYKEQKIADIKIAGTTHSSKQIIKIKNLNFSYSNNTIVKDGNFDMYGKEKVWLVGANGTGKTTLVKLILGKLKADSGEVKIGDNLKWAYFSQDQSHLNMEATVEDFFLTNTGISYNQSFSVMDKFLFGKEHRTTKIKNLSPGQRARLSFAVFSLKEYDFMILDEPTNHIDIKSKEVIEESLNNYKGSIFVVSHDRYFVKNIGVTRAITLSNNKIVEVKNIEDEYLK